MREIKFRAWDIKEKEMYYDTRFCMQAIADERYAGYGEDLELMQFTGLLDKNGKEIYEGDIVRHDWLVNGKPFEIKDLPHLYHWFIEFGTYDDPEHIEVIGTIYENPELLDKQD